MARKVKYSSTEMMPLLGGYDAKGKKILPVYKNDEFHNVVYKFYKKQESFPWTIEEIKLGGDILDWRSKLSPAEKNVISMILSLFTGSDASAVQGYAYLMRVFKPVCFTMLYAKIAAVEALHVDSYSYLSDELGFDASYYKQLNEIEESKDFVPLFLNSRVQGFDYYLEEAGKKLRSEIDNSSPTLNDEIEIEADRLFKIALAKFILTYGVLLESIHLFSLFAILFSFRQKGRMKGMATIVEFSIRDEFIHYNTNLFSYNTLLEKYPEVFTTKVKASLNRWALNAIDMLKDMEYRFIDKVFEMGDIPSISRDDVKSYVSYIVEERKELLGLPVTKTFKHNPLPYMDTILANNNLTNFFSDTVTDYQKNSTAGTWDEVRETLPLIRSIVLDTNGKKLDISSH